LIDEGSNGSYDSKAIREAVEATARRPGTIFHDEADFAGALASADEKVEAEVHVPTLRMRLWSRRPRRLATSMAKRGLD
jgi:hypothetical protein